MERILSDIETVGQEAALALGWIDLRDLVDKAQWRALKELRRLVPGGRLVESPEALAIFGDYLKWLQKTGQPNTFGRLLKTGTFEFVCVSIESHALCLAERAARWAVAERGAQNIGRKN